MIAAGAVTIWEPDMQKVTTIGLDFAKSVFQVHGFDTVGNVIIRRQLRRRYVVAFFKSCRGARLEWG